MRRFGIWIALFFLLLLTIPFLLIFGLIFPAKILGVLTVVLLSFSIRLWLSQTKSVFNTVDRIRINVNDRFFLNNEYPQYKGMNASDKKVFEDLLGVFLSKVPICFSSGDLVTDRLIALRIAMLSIYDSDGGVKQKNDWPYAVILDNLAWNAAMKELSANNKVKVLSSSF